MSLSGNPDAKVGALAGKVSSLDGAMKKAGASMREFGMNVSSAFTGAIEKVGEFALRWGKIGALGTAGILAWGVAGLNKNLENTQISLAAIFSAQGLAADVPDGMVMASGAMDKMRKDAAALPGEFEDLKNIFRTVATPAIAGGMNLEKLEKFSSETMAVSAVMEINSQQAAREMAMLLEGRAGGHNVLGMRLGFMGEKAHALHEASPEKRIDMVNAELAKYAPAIDQFQKSWEGISTTTTSNLKMLLATGTSPLFESVKATLYRINEWTDSNKGRLESMALRVGDKISDAFNAGVYAVDRWYPAVRDFAVNAYQEIANIWQRVEPIVARVGESIRGFLSDPASMGKLEHILELYGAVKVGTMAAGFLGPLAGAYSSLAGVGGAAAAGGAAVETEAAGVAAAALGVSASEAIVPLGLMAMAVYGAADAVNDSTAFMHEAAVTRWGLIKSDFSNMTTDLSQSVSSMAPAFMNVADLMGTTMLWALEQLTNQLQTFTFVANYAIQSLFGARLNKTVDESMDTGSDYFQGVYGQAIAAQAQGITRALGEMKPPRHPGGAGTNIAKVEIVVSGNDDPDRVALRVMDHLQNLKKHPRASPYTPNYSASNL